MKMGLSQKWFTKRSNLGLALLGLGTAAVLNACGSQDVVDEEAEAMAAIERASDQQQVQIKYVELAETGLEELGLADPDFVESKVVVYGGPVVQHAQGFANRVCNTWGSRACHPSTYPDHPTRGARYSIDFLVSGRYGDVAESGDGLEFGNRIARYALDSNPYKVDYVIWRGRINYKNGTGWHNYPEQGNVTGNHFDHVHVAFHY